MSSFMPFKPTTVAQIVASVLATLPLTVSASQTIDSDIDIKNTDYGFVVQDGVEKLYKDVLLRSM